MTNQTPFPERPRPGREAVTMSREELAEALRTLFQLGVAFSRHTALANREAQAGRRHGFVRHDVKAGKAYDSATEIIRRLTGLNPPM